MLHFSLYSAINLELCLLVIVSDWSCSM